MEKRTNFRVNEVIGCMAMRCFGLANKCVCTHSAMSDSLQPMDCSSPGSFVRGIIPARILVWIARPPSRRPS